MLYQLPCQSTPLITIPGKADVLCSLVEDQLALLTYRELTEMLRSKLSSVSEHVPGNHLIGPGVYFCLTDMVTEHRSAAFEAMQYTTIHDDRSSIFAKSVIRSVRRSALTKSHSVCSERMIGSRGSPVQLSSRRSPEDDQISHIRQCHLKSRTLCLST